MNMTQNHTPVEFKTVYPLAWLKIWDALEATCPLDAFPVNVQAVLGDMADAGLVKIDLGYVTRLLQPRDSDFAQQLKMEGL